MSDLQAALHGEMRVSLMSISHAQLVTYTIEWDWAAAEAFRDFEQFIPVPALLAELGQIADDADLDIAVTVRFTNLDNFVSVTQSVFDQQDLQAQTFTTDRLGGDVIAKNIATSPDYSTVTITFNIGGVVDLGYDNAATVGLFVFLLAHELLHPIQERLARSVGLTAHAPGPLGGFRAITLNAANEYRADVFAGRLLPTVLAITPDGGEPIPVTIGMILGDTHWATLGDVLRDHVNDGWDTAIYDYQVGKTDLGHLADYITAQSDQVLTLVGHAAAFSVVDPARCPAPFSGENASQDGSVKYLEPAWRQIMAQLRGAAIVPTPDEYAADQARLMDAGEQALVAMWKRLGVTFTDIQSDGSYMLNIE